MVPLVPMLLASYTPLIPHQLAGEKAGSGVRLLVPEDTTATSDTPPDPDPNAFKDYELRGDADKFFTSFNIISLGDGPGFKASKARLTASGVPESMVHMWQGANGNEQSENYDRDLDNRGKKLGVFQPDEGCPSPPPYPSPKPPPAASPAAVKATAKIAALKSAAPKPAAPKPAKMAAKAGSKKASSGAFRYAAARMLAFDNSTVSDEELDLWTMDTELDMAEPHVCMAKASFGWHQWGISVAHASAWEMAAQQPDGKWTVMLEEDAGQATVKAGMSWFFLANWLVENAPADTDFLWLSGQTPMVKGIPGVPGPTRQATADDPLYVKGATFCPHTYAITPNGAKKLIDAGHKYGVYGAVDIFMIQKMPQIMNTYMVNGLWLAKHGIMQPNPEEYAPRNSGIGFQMYERKKHSAKAKTKAAKSTQSKKEDKSY